MNPSGHPVAPDEILVGASMLLVGRDPGAEVTLQHQAVSRIHAELRPVGGGVLLRDRSSRNGTRVNSARIQERLLQDGDRVEFGPIPYEYRAGRLRLKLPSDGIRLVAQGLAIIRGNSLLLSGIDLTVLPNQFVGILGPSGAGKSTLIKCLASYVSPAAGRLCFDDAELSVNQETYRSHLGYVPQDDVVYPQLTIRENLEFALDLRVAGDLQAEERADIVASVLKQVRLEKEADRLVKNLSGGQRKRVNVATELLGRPRILFLDEPTSGLDPAGETRLMQRLKELAGQGITVLCSTHVMDNLSLFDQVVIVAGGTLAYSGSPQDVLRHFGVTSYPELYEALENVPHLPTQAVLASVVNETPGQQIPIRGPETAFLVMSSIPNAADATSRARKATGTGGHQGTPTDRASATTQISLPTQVGVQFRRGMTLILRDPPLLGLLAGQPLLIGFLINLSQFRPTDLDSIFLFAVVTAVWLGLNNTVREVVRDRPVYVRERLAGVTPEGYLGAKVLLYALVGVAQLLLLLGVIRYFSFLKPEDARDLASASFTGSLAILWTTYVAAMLLGLVVSTLAPSQEAAVAAVPLLVLPQLLLTGVATGLTKEGTYFRPLVFLLPGSTSEGSIPGWGWLLTMTSLFTYSRPAMAMLERPLPNERTMPQPIVVVADFLHLLALLLLTASVLVACFYHRERRWQEQV